MEFKHQANAYFVDELYSEAAAAYTKAIETLHQDADLYAKRAAAHLKLNQLENAVTDADHALKINAKLDVAYLRKG